MNEEYLPPPPAYSEQEFDQKIATAVQQSLSISHQSKETRNTISSNDGVKQLTNSRQPTTHNSSTDSRLLPRPPAAVEPLRIQKKKCPSPQKNPVSNSLDAATSNLNGPTSTHIAHHPIHTTDGLANYSGMSNQSTPYHDMNHIQPPPSFASLNESHQSFSNQGPQSQQPSPLNSPVLSANAILDANRLGSNLRSQNYDYIPQNAATRGRPRQSLPNHSLQQRYQSLPRPVSDYGTHLSSTTTLPRMEFDPSLAYNKTRGNNEIPAAQEAHAFNAAAFYNSAVSAHLTTPTKPARMAVERPYYMGTSRPQSISSARSDDGSQVAGSGYPMNPTFGRPNEDVSGFPNNQNLFTSPSRASPNPHLHSPQPTATHFPRYPSFSTTSSHSSIREGQWATSEDQIPGSYR